MPSEACQNHGTSVEMEMALDEERGKKYDRIRARVESDAERAKWLIDLLMEQFNGRVVIFFDNLESRQDPETLTLQDPLIAAWIQTAQTTAGLILMITSRWKPPNWNNEPLLLEHANYGDFLQMAQQLALRGKLSKVLLQRREQLRKIYSVLGGNSRGLEFFAAATLEMENADQEDAFLDGLAQTKNELQVNMAIEEIYKRLSGNAQSLLHRLPAYHEPVPLDGREMLA